MIGTAWSVFQGYDFGIRRLLYKVNQTWENHIKIKVITVTTLSSVFSNFRSSASANKLHRINKVNICVKQVKQSKLPPAASTYLHIPNLSSGCALQNHWTKRVSIVSLLRISFWGKAWRFAMNCRNCISCHFHHQEQKLSAGTS